MQRLVSHITLHMERPQAHIGRPHLGRLRGTAPQWEDSDLPIVHLLSGPRGRLQRAEKSQSDNVRPYLGNDTPTLT